MIFLEVVREKGKLEVRREKLEVRRGKLEGGGGSLKGEGGRGTSGMMEISYLRWFKLDMFN